MSPKVNRFPEKLLTFFGKSIEHVAEQHQFLWTKTKACVLHVL